MFRLRHIIPVLILISVVAHAQQPLSNEQEKELFAKAFAISMTVPQYQKFLTLVSAPPFRKSANNVIAEDRAKQIGEYAKEAWAVTMTMLPAGSKEPRLAHPDTVSSLQKYLRQYFTDTDANATAAAALVHAFYKEGAAPTASAEVNEPTKNIEVNDVLLDVTMFGAGVAFTPSSYRSSGGVIRVNGSIKNTNPFPVWDIGIQCTAFEESGTAIKVLKGELKRRIEPGKVIKVNNLVLGPEPDQTKNLKCRTHTASMPE